VSHGRPHPGDERKSGPLSKGQAEQLCRDVAKAVTGMGRGSVDRYYVASYGTSHAVFLCTCEERNGS